MDTPSQPSNSAGDMESSAQPTPTTSLNQSRTDSPATDGDNRKRKLDGARGRGGRGGRGNKRKDMGRNAWGRDQLEKRRVHRDEAPKRQKNEEGEPVPIYATQFSKEDIEADKRRPKKKVAVLLGYSGTGYHGMQMSPTEKTIEGEIFPAFVAAGAISKANATDPKKSSFVRCARTDKGVHAAGNVISLKLIIEDPDIVKKVNDALSPQIRVWGIQVTNKGFSCYQFCDSRIYEYLIPTHCFLPPHPSTFMAQKLVEGAEEKGNLEEYNARQAEVASFWEETDNAYIKPILEELPAPIRAKVEEALRLIGAKTRDVPDSVTEPSADKAGDFVEQTVKKEEQGEQGEQPGNSEAEAINEAIKKIRAAYFRAKKAYRIHPDRLARVREVLNLYVGTRNFHNYTIQKTFRDPSAKRVIKSFKVAKDPIIINGTEWLSLKVHGQSFMMHQIRKMVSMATLIIRCGSDPHLIQKSYGPQKIPIPKAPGLGLLLERPIFDTYSAKAVKENKETLNFDKYEKEIEEFKEREIYQRIFREEEESNAFGNFFNHVDTYRENTFLYLTSLGIPSAAPTPATEQTNQTAGKDKEALAEVESESEDEVVNGGEEGG